MTMEGYDAVKAKEYITEKLVKTGKYQEVPREQIERIVKEAISQDEEYMRKAGILTEEEVENPDDVYYDDDDAFEFIVDAIVEKGTFSKIPEMVIAQMVDDYMDFNEEFMEEEGLISWDAE